MSLYLSSETADRHDAMPSGKTSDLRGLAKTTHFDLEDVTWARRQIESTGILMELREWREADASIELDFEVKRAGGRPPKYVLDDVHILVAWLLLAREHSPMWTKSIQAFYWTGLTPEARIHLGVDGFEQGSTPRQQAKVWHNRSDRALQRLLKVMDPYPAPRQLMNRAEREHVLSVRERNRERWNLDDKIRRKDRFSWLMIRMTHKMLEPRLFNEWKGNLSVDQTIIKAPSGRGYAKGEFNDEDLDSLVMEMDARWAVRDPEDRSNSDTASAANSTFGYVANIAVQVANDPPRRADHPLLVAGFTLSRPNQDVGGETVKILRALVDGGYPVGRIASDKEYAANLKPENYYFPITELGYSTITDYKKTGLGIQGNQQGANIIEGAYHCPSTPTALVNANSNFNAIVDERVAANKVSGAWLMPHAHRPDDEQRVKLLRERAKYKFRQKEAASKNGSIKMICPAYGPGATAVCPLRDEHPDSSKKDKAFVAKPPRRPDNCCTQTSVTMARIDAHRYLQPLYYKSAAWTEAYRAYRNTVESMNAFLKDEGRESLSASGRRRLRGLTAHQVSITFLIVSANMRKIVKFSEQSLLEEDQKTPRVTRERNHLSLKRHVIRIPELRAQLGLESRQVRPRTKI